MSTVILPDNNSAPAARHLKRSLGDAEIVPMVLREADLRLYRQIDVPRETISAVGEQSAEIASQLRDWLPPHLVHGSGRTPSLWDCYGEYFRSWAVAPLLANAALAHLAVEQLAAQDVLAVESPRSGGWWSYRQQVVEAARAGLLGTGAGLRACPGGWARGVRACAAGLGGAWLAGAAALCTVRFLPRWRRWLRSMSPPAPADALFLAIGPTSVPIIDRLATLMHDADGVSSAAVMFHPEDAGMETRSEGPIAYQYVDNFHLCSAASSAAVGLGWLPWFTHVCRNAPKRELGRLWPGLRNRLLIALARDSQQMLADIAAAGRMLDAYKPRVVVALHLYWHRIAGVVLAARARGIPVVYVQHGVYLAKDDCINPLPYDEYLVFGRAAAEALGARVHAGTITPVGHCLYDDIARDDRRVPDAIDDLKAGRPLVLLATQPDEAQVCDVTEDRWWVKGVAEAGRELGALVAIKLHPGDVETRMYGALQRAMPDTVAVLPHGEYALADLARGADVLVTRDSTVVFEANLLGVPAVTVNLTGLADRFPFAADGGAVGVQDYERILPSLREVIQTGGEKLADRRASFLARHTGPADGRAAERIVQSIGGHMTAPRAHTD